MESYNSAHRKKKKKKKQRIDLHASKHEKLRTVLNVYVFCHLQPGQRCDIKKFLAHLHVTTSAHEDSG
jgi:hypothetical protein